MNYNIRKHCCFAGIMLLCISVQAQDTMHLTLDQAEKEFIGKNLQLLSEKYNIDISKAAVMQTKLYNNPNITLSGNLYNPTNKKVFDVSNQTGQYVVGISELITLAGKRNKAVKLSETSTRLSENRFYDLMRTLRYSLRSNFYNLLYLHNSFASCNEQISYLEKLDKAYKELAVNGTVTQKDALRIRSLWYSLKVEKTSLENQMNDLEGEMQLLLHNNKTWYLPVAESNGKELSLQNMAIRNLIDSAYQNRDDLKLAENNMLYSTQNLALQKALSKPDLNLGAEFDKRGSFTDNATAINLAIDLPLFNRNQGNIHSAKITIDQNKVLAELQKETVENEVQRAFTKALTTERTLASFDPGFRNDMEKILKAITENFQKRNITLIDFTDFYASYKDNVLQLNELENDHRQAIEALQFAVGKNIFNQ